MRSRRTAFAVTAALAAVVLLVWWAGRGSADSAASAGGVPTASDGWPNPGAELRTRALEVPAGFGLRRVFLDPGHGATDNTGNRSCFCEDEQDFTLRVARSLAERLEGTGHFQVRLSREAGETVEYPDRVERAEQWQAEAFVSLHSDVRGQPELWSPDAGLSCRRSLRAPGFSVLWSDEADEPLRAARQTLAWAVASQMMQAGWLPYGGADYRGNYTVDSSRRGVFLDRHAPDQRIFVLRRPTVPSIIIETHNALDPREARRWEQPSTLDAFAAAVAAALVQALR